jgi:chemotaxis protein methyltransferase CheR
VKAKKSLRGQCDFGSANLLERKSMPSTQFDIIFCRNVFIYVNSDQIKAITTGLLEHLNPEGFLFIGISETLNSLGLPVSTLGPSVYQHRALKPAPAPGASTATGKSPVAPSAPLPAIAALPNPIRVVCVDDSPSILTLMKQILTKEHGFEIVGTASSGLDAAQKIPALKPHAITLDIHMPEQTGIEYLEKNHRPGHPAVVMVSSVSREDAGLALRALTAGASDYVEKPALGNIQERGDEIRTKLRCAVQAGQMASAPSKALDKEFATAKRIEHPEKKLRVLILPLSARTRLQAIFKDVKASGEPPTLILIEGSPQAMASFNGEISKLTSRSTLLLDKLPDGGTLKADQIYCADFKTVFADLHTAHAKTPTSLLVLGEVSQHAAREIQAWRAGQKGNRAQLVLEDLGGNQGCKALMASASDVVPATSFIYLSCEFLCKPAK